MHAATKASCSTVLNLLTSIGFILGAQSPDFEGSTLKNSESDVTFHFSMLPLQQHGVWSGYKWACTDEYLARCYYQYPHLQQLACVRIHMQLFGLESVPIADCKVQFWPNALTMWAANDLLASYSMGSSVCTRTNAL